MKKPLLYLLLIIILTVGGFSALAQKNHSLTAPENARALILDLTYNAKTGILLPTPGIVMVADILEKEPGLSSGNFKIRLVSAANKLLAEYSSDIKDGRNFIELPYFLNTAGVEIFNPDNKILIILNINHLKTILACNENNTCELGEENLCPLDCRSAKNPNYPLTPAGKISDIQKSQPQPLEKPTTTFTPEFARNQFQNYLIFLGAGIGFLLMFFGILNWYNKRK